MRSKRPLGVNNREEVDTVDTGRFLTITVEGVATSARKDLRGRLVACNESGDRIGEGHKNAVLTDAQVEEIRDRFEAYPLGDPRHEGYRLLARAYEVSKRTIRDIVDYRRRNVWPAKWKRIDK